MIPRSVLFSATILTSVAAAAPAFAQQLPGNDSEATEITVTAQRREQALQDVPVAVSAFTPAIVEAISATNTADIARFVPSMNVVPPSGVPQANNYMLRGLGAFDSASTAESPITTYVDDVLIPRQNVNNYSFFDIERIEVLRGPQGTLFGRNTSGGAINVIMKKPARDFGGFVEGTYGSFDRVSVRGSVDLPANENVLTKFTGFYVNDPGYLKNITTGDRMNGEVSWGVRGDVRAYLGENIRWDVAAEASSSEGTNIALRNDANGKGVYYETRTGVREGDCGNPVGDYLTEAKANCSVALGQSLTSNLEVDLGGATVNYIAGLRNFDYRWGVDVTNSPNRYGSVVIFADGKSWNHSQEVKLVTDLLDGRLQLVSGIFYLYEKSSSRLTDAAGTATTATITVDRFLESSVESIAGYMQGDFNVTDALVLTVGGRYTHDIKKIGYELSPYFPGVSLSTANVVAAGIPTKQTYNKFTPRVAVNWEVAEDVKLYAAATNGFKSGGWNGRVARGTLATVVTPEKVWNYEAGLRGQFFDRRLTVNLTGFVQKTKGYQSNIAFIPAGEVNFQFLTTNVGDLETKGLEFETNFSLTDELNLFLNGSIMDSKYTRVSTFPGVPAAQQLTLASNPIQIPDYSFVTGAIYRRDVASLDGTVDASIVYRHVEPYWLNILNTFQTNTQDFLDLSIGYENKAGWSVALTCSNCTEEKSYSAYSRNLYYPTDPRRITVRLRQEF